VHASTNWRTASNHPSLLHHELRVHACLMCVHVAAPPCIVMTLRVRICVLCVQVTGTGQPEDDKRAMQQSHVIPGAVYGRGAS
jgi:hypothetical protein